jgi:hypothetical protein
MTRDWITRNIQKLIEKNPGAPEIAELRAALKKGEIYGMSSG